MSSTSNVNVADISVVEVPFDAGDTAIASALSDGVEKNFSKIDCIIFATHTLVGDSGLRSGAKSSIDDSDIASAIWIVVAQGAHKFVRESDYHIVVGVNGPTASAHPASPVCNVPYADLAGTFTWSALTLLDGSSINKGSKRSGNEEEFAHECHCDRTLCVKKE